MAYLLFIFIFHLCSSIDLSNSFSHIVPIQPFFPVLVNILLFSPDTEYALLSLFYFWKYSANKNSLKIFIFFILNILDAIIIY